MTDATSPALNGDLSETALVARACAKDRTAFQALVREARKPLRTIVRRLVGHLRERTDVQNIELMQLAGFCRNCLSNWYREAAEESGKSMTKEESREIVYGMPYSEWKAKYQTEATPDQMAAFEEHQKSEGHS